MIEHDRTYLVGIWTVKPGQIAAFVDAWQAFATWVASNQAGAQEGLLLQDTANPHEFVSFGSWADPEQAAELGARSEMQAFIARARDLCEDIQRRRMRVSGSAARRNGG